MGRARCTLPSGTSHEAAAMSSVSPGRELATALTPGSQVPTTPGTAPAACRNCGAPLSGPYCAACGQRDVPADPTLREAAADLAENVLNVDGRVAATFRALVRRPGELTVAYLRGRRAPYLSPFRAYLTCSVLYFAVAALAPEPVRTIASQRSSGRPGVAIDAGARIEVTGANDEDLARMRAQAEAMRRSGRAVPRSLGALAAKAMADPQLVMRRYEEARPKLMFLLVPAFAALAAAFFRGRFRYPAHLAFALHVHAFAFLALVLVELAGAVDRLGVIIGTALVAWTAILVYLVLAVRRVYELRLAAALGRSAALAVAYYVVLSAGQLVALAVMLALL